MSTTNIILHKIGSPFVNAAFVLTDSADLLVRCFLMLFKPPWRKNEIILEITKIGIGSLPIISVSTAFAGLVISNEIAWHMDQALNSVSMIPGFTGQFILRELGVAIPALLVVSKVGAAITAEIGTMKVTDQIDALKLLGIHRISYLVFPRWVATIISLVCLTAIATTITLFFAMSVAVMRYGFSVLEYVNMVQKFVGLGDMVCILSKSTVFGAIIPVISCSYGLHCQGGAQGVGTATTQSVVTSTVVVIVLDFILTYVFSHFL